MDKIAFDITEMRPGCALVQATFGCNPLISHHFPTGSWLLAPTPDMRVYPITKEKLLQLVEKVEKTSYQRANQVVE